MEILARPSNTSNSIMVIMMIYLKRAFPLARARIPSSISTINKAWTSIK